MSELKAYNATIHPKMKNACDGAVEVYLKYEADKVIAEKDKKIIQLNALIENYNRISREIIDNANHQKYKRCLEIARFCQYRSEIFFTWSKKRGFLLKWHNRWMELAEKFKEAK